MSFPLLLCACVCLCVCVGGQVVGGCGVGNKIGVNDQDTIYTIKPTGKVDGFEPRGRGK